MWIWMPLEGVSVLYLASALTTPFMLKILYYPVNTDGIDASWTWSFCPKMLFLNKYNKKAVCDKNHMKGTHK